MVLPTTPVSTAFFHHNISNTISYPYFALRRYHSLFPSPLPPSPLPPPSVTGLYRGELCRVQQCRGQRCRAPGTQAVPLGSRAHTHYICQRRPHQPSTRRREIFQAAREGEGEMVILPILTPSFTPFISLPPSLKYSITHQPLWKNLCSYSAILQVCFACRKKKFSVFTRSTACHICKRYVSYEPCV